MKLGYALYSARELCQNPAGLADVLRQVAAMGYDGVEFFQYAGTPAADIKALLAECGLTAIGTHVHKERWDADTPGEIAYAAAAGIPWLVCPWLAPQLRTEAVYRTLPDTLAELAQYCAKAGIGLQYHNHEFEFDRFATLGGTAMDYLLAGSSAYQLELDSFWAFYAKQDPIAYLQAHKSRIGMIHVKDCTSYDDGQNGAPAFCALGQGIVDNGPLIRQAAQMGVNWTIVELDTSPGSPLDSARASLAYIKQQLA